MKLTYTSNNSGGSWWLSDDDWHRLESAGWEVEWLKARWLGALATSASIDAHSPGDAMRSFEAATSQSVSDEGCNCCGPPHVFSWEGGFASGEDCLPYLFEGKEGPTSLREAWESSE